MNLYTLKQICAAYHNKTVAQLTDSKTGVDLFLVAVNNARKAAEEEHSFESTWGLATLVVNATTGGALTAATLVPSATFSGIREIISIEGDVRGRRRPLILRRPNKNSTSVTVPRYPTDSEVETCGNSYLLLRGDTLYQFPDLTTNTPLTIYLEMYGWLKDYTDAMLSVSASAPDFLVEHGFEYLQWTVILELNYSFQTFVFRQEGNPGAPEKKQQAAWDKLVTWDSYRAHFSDDR